MYGGGRVSGPGKENKFELRRQQVLANRNRQRWPGIVPAAAQPDSSGQGLSETGPAAALAGKPEQGSADAAHAGYPANYDNSASGELPQPAPHHF